MDKREVLDKLHQEKNENKWDTSKDAMLCALIFLVEQTEAQE